MGETETKLNEDLDDDREKNEARTRLIKIKAREVSIVGVAANERELIAIKDKGGKSMNPEVGQDPIVELTVEKALDLSKQIMREQGEVLLDLINRMIAGDVAREDRELFWDLAHNFNSNAWVHRVAKAEKTIKGPEDYPVCKISENEAEKANDNSSKLRELLGKAKKLAGDNKDLVDILSEMDDLLVKISKNPFPMKSKEDTVSKENEMTDAEKKEAEKKAAEKEAAEKEEAAKKAAGMTDAEKKEAEKKEAEKKAAEKEAAEKKEAEKKAAEKDSEKDAEKDTEKARMSEAAKLIEKLKSDRSSIDKMISLIEGDKEKKTEKADGEEMKSLRESVATQGKAIEGLRKDLEGVVKVRGASKAADEADTSETERAKGVDKKFWEGVI